MRNQGALVKTILIASLVSTVLIASMQHAEAVYPDPSKTIEFIVPVGVGGGYDLYVRMIAPYLSKELGGVKFRIKNEPGGAWLVGLNEIYKAKPDGYTIGIWNPGLLIQDKDILGKVNYDMTTFTFIYRITNEPRIVIVQKKRAHQGFQRSSRKRKIT